jgi:translocation and assembly module TamA
MDGFPVNHARRVTARRLLAAGAAALCLLGGGTAWSEVVVDGVNGAERDNVLALMQLDDESCDAPEWRIRRLYEQAATEVRDALEAFGYYLATVQRSLEIDEECWRATFTIVPGPATVVRTIDVQLRGAGERDDVFRGLLTRSPLAPGLRLRHADYNAYKKRFVDLANRRGYFDGAFEVSRLDVYPDEAAADVTLIFVTGERYRFGAVTLDQDVVDDELLRRFVGFAPGEPYDAALIAAFYEDLLLTSYFETVDIRTAPRPAPDLDVPVNVRLTGASPRTYTAGVGYGTDTGAKLRAGYINRRRNRAGHQTEARASVSQVLSEVGLSYRIPLNDPRAEWLNFDAGYQYEDTDTLRSKEAKLGVKALKRRGSSWLETRFIDLSYEDFEVGTDFGTSFLVLPGISWSQTRVSGLPRPLNGHRLNLQFKGTTKLFGSDAQFLQAGLFGKLVRPLWAGARVLARGETAVTIKQRFSDLPASVRYFAGGDVSVRGYDYKALGPVDDTGAVIGGSHLLVGSIELDQRVRDNWSIAAFSDVGNAFEDFDAMDLKTSVGGGLRWYSPLGPIRVDIAFPLDSDAPDDWRLHISLGPDL